MRFSLTVQEQVTLAPKHPVEDPRRLKVNGTGSLDTNPALRFIESNKIILITDRCAITVTAGDCHYCNYRTSN